MSQKSPAFTVSAALLAASFSAGPAVRRRWSQTSMEPNEESVQKARMGDREENWLEDEVRPIISLLTRGWLSSNLLSNHLVGAPTR
jgi:hypothetical protein